MSQWISWARDKIGMGDGSEQQPRSYLANEQEEYDMRELQQKRSTLLRTQKMQLDQLQDELEELQEAKKFYIQRQDKVKLRDTLERIGIIEEETETLQGKIDNQEYLEKQFTDAHQNRDQAKLMQAGAKEMESIVNDTERIDLDSVVDRYEDASRTTDSFNKRLAKPMRRGGGAIHARKRQENVDAELDRLMQEEADKRMASLDMMPQNTPAQDSNPLTQSTSELSAFSKTTNKPVLQEEK